MAENNDLYEKNSVDLIDDEIANINIQKIEELEHLIKILDQIETHIKSLWECVIIPYLNNYNEREILCKLQNDDYYKFHNYMLKNNKLYVHVLNKINKLQNE